MVANANSEFATQPRLIDGFFCLCLPPSIVQYRSGPSYCNTCGYEGTFHGGDTRDCAFKCACSFSDASAERRGQITAAGNGYATFERVESGAVSDGGMHATYCAGYSYVSGGTLPQRPRAERRPRPREPALRRPP